jgi:hypothetical protein
MPLYYAESLEPWMQLVGKHVRLDYRGIIFEGVVKRVAPTGAFLTMREDERGMLQVPLDGTRVVPQLVAAS